jgi:hypothetical protein
MIWVGANILVYRRYLHELLDSSSIVFLLRHIGSPERAESEQIFVTLIMSQFSLVLTSVKEFFILLLAIIFFVV